MLSSVERSLMLIKPDAIAAVAPILHRVETCGLEVRCQRRMRLTSAQADVLYAGHRHRPFYGALIDFITSDECVAVIVAGDRAVDRLNKLCGFNQPALAAPFTLRAMFGTDPMRNAVHSSSSVEEAISEIDLLFPPEEGKGR